MALDIICIIPKSGEFQNLKNNLGRKVKVKGEEVYRILQITISVYTETPPTDPCPQYEGLGHYRLEDAKIVKVY